MNADFWRKEFARLLRERTQQDSAWLKQLRKEAFGLFEAQGVPTTRLEEWRYTNLSALEKLEFESSFGPESAAETSQALTAAAAETVTNEAAARFVFIDGHYREELSRGHSKAFINLATLRNRDPNSLRGRLGGLAQPKRHAFAALNTAFLDDGAVIRVPADTQLEQPIHLVFIASPGAVRAQHPRILVHLEKGSRARIVQEHRSAGRDAALTNAVSEIHAMEDSALEFVLLQHESESVFNVSDTSVSIERNARVHLHTVTLGGRLVRNDLRARIQGEGGECRLSGLFFAQGEGLVDNHTEVDHSLPHGTSSELYKGILNDNAKGVFRGRVIVAPDAQKTDARQRNPNLLLGDGAEIDSRPQLEIRADDVRCSHGTSIGRLEEEALFYLLSRGIDPAQATELLAQGFANEILDSLPVEGLATALAAELRQHLNPTSLSS